MPEEKDYPKIPKIWAFFSNFFNLVIFSNSNVYFRLFYFRLKIREFIFKKYTIRIERKPTKKKLGPKDPNTLLVKTCSGSIIIFFKMGSLVVFGNFQASFYFYICISFKVEKFTL